MKVGECCQSPIFHGPGDESTWIVQLYPNGKTERSYGYISLYAGPEIPMKSECKASISFTLLDEKKNELYVSGARTYNFPALRTARHGQEKISRGDFLSVDNLLVHCKVEYQVKKLLPIYGKHSDLATDISRFLTSTSNGDVTFIVGGKEFQAHKAILSARSPVFAAMFQHDMKEAALNRVDVVEIEPDIFQALLRFIYTDQVDLTSENATGLLAVANVYFLDLLKWKCEQYLAQDLTTTNFTPLLFLARAHEAINLKEAIVDFIRKSPTEVNTEEWKELKKTCPELALEILETLFRSASFK